MDTDATASKKGNSPDLRFTHFAVFEEALRIESEAYT